MYLYGIVIMSLLGVVLSIEVETIPIQIPQNSEAIEVYSYTPKKSGGIEINLNLLVSRIGVFGTLLDWMFVPSDTLVDIVDGEGQKVFSQTSNALISTSVNSSKVQIYVTNLNTYFSINVVLVGQVLSDILDLRKVYPQCVFPVYSQGACGACYADVVAGSGSDALCTSGISGVGILSPQPIVSCSELGGCNGGSPYLAALWVHKNGIEETNVCPYTSNTCRSDFAKNGCVECSSLKLNNLPRKFFFKPIILHSEDEMRRKISNGGSVMVIFDAHVNFQEFFFRHPYGLYNDTHNSPSLGNHAVRLIGFGIDENEKYWLGVNSWGASWADSGTFKIKRGSNFCLIEQYPVAIEYTGTTPAAGLAASDNSHTAIDQTVGEWKNQDINDPYWTNFIKERNQTGTLKIETRVAHGYTVRITGTTGDAVLIHFNPDGTLDTPTHNFVIVH